MLVTPGRQRFDSFKTLSKEALDCLADSPY